ncbi:MAG TPA: MBL fold metallo-hydrolase [Ilumatobacteraceae bacterium]|nr:MBL fold metallo-hydrolase [Ilumatobacteraceae bacterium]
MSNEVWQIGSIRVTLVREALVPIPPAGLFPDADTAPVIDANRSWLAPHFLTDDGTFPLSIHAFVVQADGRTMVVDSCIGDRPVPGHEAMSNIGDGWLRSFAAAGFDPATVDLVLCTHLHFDHVGWNTRLVDGAWVPTFPHARYLFGRHEYEHWATGADGYAMTFTDAVQAVVDAGLADLVDTDHVVSESVCLESTPGHSPGHVSIHLRSGDEHAVITGDMLHHPVQIAAVDWRMGADYDSVEATATRRRFFAANADTSTQIFGTHFAPPTRGWIRSDGDGYRFDVQPSADEPS